MSSITHIQTSKGAPLDGIHNSRAWLKESDCVLQDLIDVVEGSKTMIEDYPMATESIGNAVVYDRDRFVTKTSDTIPSDVGRALEREMMHAFKEGPGIVVIRGAWYDLDVVDECTKVFQDIIREERESGEAAGDHFGKPGANSRIWNAHEKLAVNNPDVYVRYYANDVLPIVGRAWLGPHYQVTAQVNIVHPGGEAQQAHRDYHLGFMENADAERFPAHVHGIAAAMTLQGAVAHCDMPVESGPTEYLPHSHKYVKFDSTSLQNIYRHSYTTNHSYTDTNMDIWHTEMKILQTTLRTTTFNFLFQRAMRCSSILHCCMLRGITKVNRSIVWEIYFSFPLHLVEAWKRWTELECVDTCIRNYLSTAVMRRISRANMSKMLLWLPQRDTVSPQIWISINPLVAWLPQVRHLCCKTQLPQNLRSSHLCRHWMRTQSDVPVINCFSLLFRQIKICLSSILKSIIIE